MRKKKGHPDPRITSLIAHERLPRCDALTVTGQPAWTLPTLLGHLGVSLDEFAACLPHGTNKGVCSRNRKNRPLSLRGSQQSKDNRARYRARVLKTAFSQIG